MSILRGQQYGVGVSSQAVCGKVPISKLMPPVLGVPLLGVLVCAVAIAFGPLSGLFSVACWVLLVSLSIRHSSILPGNACL